MTNCPLPLARLAEHVGEIIAAVEWASFQSEYGVSEDEWLRDNENIAKDMLQWIDRYRQEVLEHISCLQRTIEMLDVICLTVPK